MNLLTFDQCLDLSSEARAKKNHVLLGNGFSRACKDEIFSYGSLYETAEFEQYSDVLKKVFLKLDTTDFEVIMKALENSSLVTEVYEAKNTSLISRLKDDAESLRKLLVQTLTQHHPEKPDEISDSEYQCCLKFLSNFENIYTLNYDMLLYWTLMKATPLRDDGFRDPFAGEPQDYFEEDYVVWENDTHAQDTFYLHGALHLFMGESNLQKYCWSRTGVRLLEQIDVALKSGRFPLVVAEGETEQKQAKIQRSNYLGHGFRSLASKHGNLFIFGHSLADNDQHILDQVARNNNLYNLYVSIYGDPDTVLNKKIREKANSLKYYKSRETRKEIHFYDACSVKVWR